MNVRPTMEVALKSVSIDLVVTSADAEMDTISTLTTAPAMARFVLFYLVNSGFRVVKSLNLNENQTFSP